MDRNGQSLPKSIGENILPPVYLTDEQENLGKRLDEWHKQGELKKKPSDMLRGAIFAIRRECESNPDCISQAANSLREILYPFQSPCPKNVLDKKIKSLKKFGSVTVDEDFYNNKVECIWKRLNDITHHGVDPQSNNFDFSSFDKAAFQKLLVEFQKVMDQALTRQLDVHQIIDQALMINPLSEKDMVDKKITSIDKQSTKLDPEKIQEIINLNFDAQEYFFAKVNENWLSWLWYNGLLDAIKQKSKDLTKYGYRMPELNYLVRMVEKKAEEVVDIMLSVAISKDSFNPEVIGQFLRICSSLSAEQLARMVPKIRDDNWVQLMSVFNQWGFDYEKMFQTLATAKDYRNLLILAEAVLVVKSKKECSKASRGYSSDNPFYFNDLSSTKIFEHLVAVDNEYIESALSLVTKAMSAVVRLGDDGEKNEVFPIRDTFYLFDVDFFSLKLGNGKRHLDRENVKDLAATVKILTQRLIGGNCDKPELVMKTYRNYIQTLPDSRSMWRLHLFVLSLCPSVFQAHLKQSFSKLFEVMDVGRHYYEIESGTEYKKTLKQSFSVLDSDYQREYVSNVFRYFGQSCEDKKEEQWYRRDGWQILSSICASLTQKEKEDCEKVFGEKCDPTFEPEPTIGKMVSGYVKPKAVISQDEFNKLPIAEIAKRLRTDWKPEALSKQNTSDDFLNPLNAEDVGGQLRIDIAKRLQDYIEKANLFFDRNILDEHYTYSFFKGIQESIRADKIKASKMQWDKLIDIFINIKDSGVTKAFDYKTRERKKFDAWLSDWTGVHSALTDILQELLSQRGSKPLIDFNRHRNQLLEIISYLLTYLDPEPKDEELEIAATKTYSSSNNAEYYVSDPFTMAVNTVRGRAFQAFVLFVCQDEKQFKKESKVKIAEDVKRLYEKILKEENTRALMFMFGHYLPSFYFRDIDLVHGLLPQIFPKDSTKKHLYLAAWEGYLANNLYEEIFFDPEFQKLYERGLNLTGAEDSERKYFKEPNKSIAIHVALAFVVYNKKFGFDSPLFKEFWKQNIKRQSEFISFVGRMFISGDNVQANEYLKKDSEVKNRLVNFWEWLLQNYNDPKLFTEFGFWMNLEKKIFDPVWLAKQIKATLDKTKGVLGWDHALIKSMNEMAKVAPKETLEIARLCLFEGGVRGGKMDTPFMYGEKCFEALKSLYVNTETKDGTYALIDDLVRDGGNAFWKLKEILD